MKTLPLMIPVFTLLAMGPNPAQQAQAAQHTKSQKQVETYDQCIKAGGQRTGNKSIPEQCTISGHIFYDSRPPGVSMEAAAVCSADSPVPSVSNPAHDFSAVNLGRDIELAWHKLPPNTKFIKLSRATSPQGPWTILTGDMAAWRFGREDATFGMTFSDPWIRGDVSDMYYHLEILNAAKQIIKDYGIIRLDKCKSAPGAASGASAKPLSK